MLNGMLFVICLSMVVSVLFGFVFFTTVSLYLIPYFCWLGLKMDSGQYTYLKKESFFAMLKHATQLYRHWIFRKELEL